MQLVVSINCYMFLHCSVILKESSKRKEYKSNTLAFLG